MQALRASCLPAAAVLLLCAPPNLGRPYDPPPPPPPIPLEEILEKVGQSAADLPRLHSLLVSINGDLVFERYANGAAANRTTNIKSASKSVIAALVGIAVDRGLLALDDPIAPYFPRLLPNDADPVKRTITVEDLVSMRAGLETTSGRNYGRWAASRNWSAFALNQPIVAEPGGRMIYSTGSSHLLSAVLTKATGKSTWDFAREALAEPLGFTLARWQKSPEGVYFGGNNMAMTPRQLLAFGELYRNNGVVDGKQVLSAEWIRQSFIPRGRSRYSGQLYGYGWWMRNFAGQRAYFAWGYGGQYVFVIPGLDLTIVTTSSPEPSRARRGHRAGVFDLLEEDLVRPLLTGRR